MNPWASWEPVFPSFGCTANDVPLPKKSLIEIMKLWSSDMYSVIVGSSVKRNCYCDTSCSVSGFSCGLLN